MNRTFTLSLAFFSMILFTSLANISLIQAQTLNGEWSTDYVTDDNPFQGTNQRTISVGVIKENTFVALVQRSSNKTNYLVGYTNADSSKGRMGDYSQASGTRQVWSSGFDAITMNQAVDLAVTKDSLVFVANNDPERNILVFRMSTDSVITADFRMITGADSLWAIDLDDLGRVYVSSIKDSVTPSEVLIFNSISQDPEWGGLHQSSPVQTVVMPEPGEIRGVSVSGDGSIIFASNYTTRKIYCFTGDPVNGYTQFNGFNFTLNDSSYSADSTLLVPGPWGLNLMPEKNILFVASDVNFRSGVGYEYGKIFALNPNNAEILDTIDVAAWNLKINGSTTDHTTGRASGFTSTYNVDFDESFNLYSQSYYGWTVEKWKFSGTLPVIPITITSVEKINDLVPDNFTLSQNYPNPFNPSTTIEFSIEKQSQVSLSVYSVTGQFITELIKPTEFSKGSYKVTFNASKLASGTYIYVLRNGSRQISKKMTLLK